MASIIWPLLMVQNMILFSSRNSAQSNMKCRCSVSCRSLGTAALDKSYHSIATGIWSIHNASQQVKSMPATLASSQQFPGHSTVPRRHGDENCSTPLLLAHCLINRYVQSVLTSPVCVFLAFSLIYFSLSRVRYFLSFISETHFGSISLRFGRNRDYPN